MNRRISLCLLVALTSLHGVVVYAQRHATQIKESLMTVGTIPEAVFRSIPVTGSLAVTPDEKYCLFASRAGGMSWNTSGFSGKIIWDADIYVSERKDSGWSVPVNLGKKINDRQDQGAPAVTVDGQAVYFLDYRQGWQNDGGPIYRGSLHGRNWSNAEGLGGAITDFFIKTPFCGGITISPDGKTLIASAAASSTGRSSFHLYIFHKNAMENWSEGKSLSLNSDSSEINPHFAADGVTLYFASNGYEGFGSFDVYKTVVDGNDSCGEVYNLGASVNSALAEMDISFNLLSTRAYLKRGTDLFRITVDPTIKTVTALPSIMLAGRVTDATTGIPVEATLVLFQDTATDYIAHSNSNSGEYALVVRPQTAYTLRISALGNSVYEEKIFIEDPKALLLQRNFVLQPLTAVAAPGFAVGRAVTHSIGVAAVTITIRDTASLVEQFTGTSDSLGFFEIRMPAGNACVVTLEKKDFFPRSVMVYHDKKSRTSNLGDIEMSLMQDMAATGEGIRLSTIQFDKGAAIIRAQSFGELDRIANALKDAKVGHIHISGYSDSRGNEDLNMHLSRKRAEAVAHYLVEKGVPETKVLSFGFGCLNPVASNETEEGRQLNRRVEFKLIE